MRKRDLEARRQRNRELAAMDAKHRCSACKRAMPKTGGHLVVDTGQQFCSLACALDLAELDKAGEGRWVRLPIPKS